MITNRIKRGANASLPNGAAGEPLFTTDTYDLYIGKGDGTNQRYQKYMADAINGTGVANQLAYFSGANTIAGSTFLTLNLTADNGYLILTGGSTYKNADIWLNRYSNAWENAIRFQTNGTTDWYVGSSATGSNSDFEIYNYGTSANGIKIAKATNNVTVGGTLTATVGALATAATNFVTSDSGTLKSRTAAEVLSDIGAQATSEKGQNNGYASLDSGGKVPVTQLPNSIMEYKGNWNATTNTPTLADGTGNAGDVYLCNVAGTVNLGSGNITFAVGDWCVYNGTIWQKSINSNAVVSVNGQTGVVVITLDSISPMTTLGDIIYGGASGTATRLAGNTTTTRRFLRQTGTGSVSAAPAWDTVTKTDVGLSNVENTALSTWAGSTNITTLGTITAGTWNGTTIAIANGGTGATTKAAAFDALSPMTTLGDIIYGGASGTGTRLAGNTAASKRFLTQTGDGTVSAAPSWGTISSGDVSFGNQTANTVFAGPTTGAAAAPTFRALVAADIPALSYVGGSGTINYVSKWTSASALGDSALQEVSGNLGLGVTPPAWTDFKAINIFGSSLSVNSTGGGIIIARNWYYGGGEKYYGNGTAQRLELVLNGFYFQTAIENTSGAGAALTWVNSMTLKSTAQLQLNQYGSGTFTGTRAYDLAVDASGNIIEVAIGAGTVTGSGSAGQVAYWSGSSAITGESNLFWDATNNRLGIGNDVPTAQLHLRSGGSYTNTDANNRLLIERDSHAYILFSSPDGYDQGLHFHNTTDDAFVGRIAYEHVSTGDSLNFIVGGGTPFVYFTAGKRVGIGKEFPNYDLEVESSNISTAISVSNTDAAGAARLYLINAERSFILTNNTDDNLSFYYAGSNRLQFNLTDQWFNTGKLGVGTDSPYSTLQVAGSIGATGLRVSSAPTVQGVYLGMSTASDAALRYACIEMVGGADGGSEIDFTVKSTDKKGRIAYENSSNVMRFETDGSSRVTIGATGTVAMSAYTTNGFVKFSAGDGTLAVDTTTYLSGSGTAGKLPKYTAANTLGNSIITESGIVLGINTTPYSWVTNWASIADFDKGGLAAPGDPNFILTANCYYGGSPIGWRYKTSAIATRIEMNEGTGMAFYIAATGTENDLISTTFKEALRLVNDGNGTVRLSSYTSNGFVKTGSSNGTLSIDTTTYNSGSGTSGYIAKYTGANTLGNSLIYESGGKVAINTTTVGSFVFQVEGSMGINHPTSNTDFQIKNATNGKTHYIFSDATTGQLGIESGTGAGLKFNTNGANTKFEIASGGLATFTSSVTSGTPNVEMTSSGATTVLKVTNTAASGVSRLILSNAERDLIVTNNAGDDLLSFNYASANRLQFSTSDQWFPSGKLGVGTETPQTNLQISSSTGQTDTYGYVQAVYTGSVGSANAGYTAKNYSGTSQFMQWETYGLRIGSRIVTNSGAGDLYFTAGADSVKMFIGSNGKVGINTNSPYSTLDVAGSIGATGVRVSSAPTVQGVYLGNSGTTSGDYATIEMCGGSSGGCEIDFTKPSNDWRGRIGYNLGGEYMWFSANAAEAMRINSAQELLIGYTSDQGSYRLQVNGSVLASAYYESSDIRLKDVLTNSYSENFSAIEFMWKDKRDEKKHWGYAAQDVMKYIPDAIEVNKHGMMTVNYNEAHTWKIAQLEKEILQLKAKIK